LAAAVAASLLYLPASQLVQSDDAELLATVLYFPTPQTVHDWSAVDAKYSPATQAVQSSTASEPAGE
jgi:hypothetical protein